jgi:hypothetical protein
MRNNKTKEHANCLYTSVFNELKQKFYTYKSYFYL